MSVAISFSGYNQRRKVTRAVIDWFCPRFIGKHNIAIDVVTRGMVREGNFGTCGIIDSCSRPREFEIELHAGLNPYDYITTLIHELIHVKQRVKREHVTKYDKNYWFSRIVPEDTSYADEPWEVEAHRDETWITKLAIHEIGLDIPA